MRITEIQIVPIKPKDGLVGFASFVFEESFYIGSVGIYTRPEGGYRLTYPTRKYLEGSINVVYPINKFIARKIEDEVVSKFEEVVNGYGRHNKVNYE